MLEHVYFEPKYCSDVVVKYMNTCYHSHKAVLASNSKQFYALFENSQSGDEKNPLELPTLTCPTFAQKQITELDMSMFLGFFYDHSIAPLRGKNSALIAASMGYLAHYYQCTSMESIIQAHTLGWFTQNAGDCDLGLALASLHEAELFQWTEVSTLVVNMLSKLQIDTASTITLKEIKSGLRRISSETKDSVLARLLSQDVE